MIKLDNLVFKYTREVPVPSWPPEGNYDMCARLYISSSSQSNEIVMNTVSWTYDSGSTPTYSDANCTNYLSDLSGWNDGTPNTSLPISGEDSNGKYVNIFTKSSPGGVYGDPWDFCVILANYRVATVAPGSYEICRIDVYSKDYPNNYYTRTNNNFTLGAWIRNNSQSVWTAVPISNVGGSSIQTVIRPFGLFYPEDNPTFPTVQIGNQIWMAENLHEDDGGEGIVTVNSVYSQGYELGPQTYYTYDAAVRVANTINGWHLPSQSEWSTLIQLMNGDSTDVKSTYGWNNDGNGTNLTGLNILPVGRIDPWSSGVSNNGAEANIWSSTNINDSNAYATFIYNSTAVWNRSLTSRSKSYKNSVRLIKDTI